MTTVHFHRRLWIGLFLLLLIPLIAMFVSNQVRWTLFDFVFATVMLSILGLVFEFIWAKLQGAKRWLAIGLSLVSFVIVWGFLATTT